MTPRADVLTRVEAVNLGLEQFADALRAQGAPGGAGRLAAARGRRRGDARPC